MKMNHATRRVSHFAAITSLLQAITLLGCSGSSDNGGGGSTTGTGGNTSTGATYTSGGSAATTGGTAATVGGTASIGGTPSTVVTTGVGGTATAGGASSAGGTSTSGGSTIATGGTTAKGGSSSTGGASSVGGSSAIGGTTAKGGASSTGGTTATGGTSSTGGTATATVAATKLNEALLTNAGTTLSAYGGYLNGEAFQQDGILTYNNYQYTAFWNTARHVVLARRSLPNGTWATRELTDYTNTTADDHNTISLGVSPADGTLHLSFDHHGQNLNYRRSSGNILSTPASVNWTTTPFTTTTSALVGTTTVTLVTYPRFITRPDGSRMLFSLRTGNSGAGDEHLWEYASGTWTYVGKYINGSASSVNAYLHGISYQRGTNRLHAAWCWRENPGAETNHDLIYVYSDDHGRTWKNNADTQVGTASTATNETTAIRPTSTDINVWPIGQNRGLINQEHMAVDSLGRVHVLLGHMPDGVADDANFANARSKSVYFHYWRDATKQWKRDTINSEPIRVNHRGKFAITSSNNLYAILPGINYTTGGMRILGSSSASGYSTWTKLVTDTRGFYSDPLIDTARLLQENVLTIFFPMLGATTDSDGSATSSDIYTLNYQLD